MEFLRDIGASVLFAYDAETACGRDGLLAWIVARDVLEAVRRGDGGIKNIKCYVCGAWTKRTEMSRYNAPRFWKGAFEWESDAYVCRSCDCVHDLRRKVRETWENKARIEAEEREQRLAEAQRLKHCRSQLRAVAKLLRTGDPSVLSSLPEGFGPAVSLPG
jgi:hypothetical protein